ncbi:GntR family transcriptional regulator [Lichenicoccus roseus]|uniref:GntR family transcriptional regulator n=1 Tax=Lichenicoccus roseus TaxID=2683649 RepID=A0A5R9J9I0_9PROT|nr:GntR family transcriptional regulator [Lichenicoccus roseus]TLU73207.1 GntR family transcriptional regulator [Lichenicoccus roseus]
MSKPNTLFKQAYNRSLDLIADQAALPSEPELSAALQVSRTTIRAILHRLAEQGLLAPVPHARRILRLPAEQDYFPKDEVDPIAVVIERRFMQKILAEGSLPGGSINELELAREVGVSTSSVREFLIRFSRYGLIEKRRNSTWILKGFTRAFALELTEVREMFEQRSAKHFIGLPPEHPAWRDLAQIEALHDSARRHDPIDEADFAILDERFHRLIHAASDNRFVTDFYDVIALVFHYHYRWNKSDAARRNRVAIDEHLAYIAALRSRDRVAVDRACRTHLRSARQTLLASIVFVDEPSVRASQTLETSP